MIPLLPLAAMIIAVNTRLLLEELEGYGYFTRELFRILTRKHPGHQFYFLFDRAHKEEYVFAPNVHPLVLSPTTRLPFLWKYWFDLRVPVVLKKIRADVFVSLDGYCSLTTRVPQCMAIHDLGFLHHPEAYKKTHVAFLKKYTPRFLRKARTVVTVSQFSKDDLVKQYKIDPSKIKVIYNGVKDIFRPVSWDEKMAMKEKYTGGHEFFIYVGAIQPRKNLVNLLKAFSIFKKRMQSSMKLVLTGRLAWKNEEFLKLINTYKYKDDVVMTGYLPAQELPLLLGSAYAMVYPSLFEGFGVPVAEAMECGVPVLTSEGTAMQEIAGEAALYFDPRNPSDIGQSLMLIYRDEDLRKLLIEKGERQAKNYHWEKSADLLWESILQTVDTTSSTTHQ